MSNHVTHQITATGDSLFARVISILEQARANVVRAVNTNMVLAYWLIGREIVLELQGGEERAEYGQQVMEKLSEQLTGRYGTGFSVPNLQNFRKFYLIYPERIAIQYLPGTNFTGGAAASPKQYQSGREFAEPAKLSPSGRELEDRFKVPGDNPTIGLILCSDKGEAVAKYSVLSEGKQIFASKYLKFLPTEEELKLEIEKERGFIERAILEKGDETEI
jgi:hypothetical protein